MVSIISRPLCEVRVPTFKRPEFLRRALTSLRNQSESNWVAIVFDDSPLQEASNVVDEFADRRIIYQSNRSNLGAAGNLDQAFRTTAYLEAQYAFVLEDDNSVSEIFIQENISLLQKRDIEILLRNQWIGIERRDNHYHINGQTTRGDIFQDEVINKIDLQASLFLCEGISNGGLFWRTDSLSNLCVGPTVASAALQEFIRTLQIRTPILFVSEPLATFSVMPDGSTTRETLTNRQFARARQAILRRLTRKYGISLIKAAQRLARSKSLQQILARQFADTMIYPYMLSHPRQSFKGFAKALLVRDPLCDYWKVQASLEAGDTI